MRFFLAAFKPGTVALYVVLGVALSALAGAGLRLGAQRAAQSQATQSEIQQAEQLAKSGDGAGAQRKLERALAVEPGNAAAWYLLGIVQEKGDGAASETAFQRATSLEPQKALYWRHLGAAQAKQGKSAAAERSYREALRLAPAVPSAQAGLASVLRANNPNVARLTEAETLLRTALISQPDYGFARFELGRVLLAQGDADGAASVLEISLSQYPHSPGVWYALTRAYRQQGNSKKAAETAARFRKIQQAVSETDRLLVQAAQRPDDPYLRLMLGRALAAQGESGMAEVQFRKCLALEPTNEEARRDLRNAEASR